MLESDDFTPDWFSKPVDSLLALIKRHDTSVEEVASSIDGGMETIRRLARGTIAIDDAMANAFSRSVGGSPSFWLKRQANYERALEAALKRASEELDGWLECVPAPGERPRGRLSEAGRAAQATRVLWCERSALVARSL